MSVQGVIATLNAPTAVTLSQLLIIAQNGTGPSAIWDVDWLKEAVFSSLVAHV
jgi:hypothetical protein